MDQTGCLGIGRRIYVPLVPLFWTVSQIEVLRVLLTELGRSDGPFFGFLCRKSGSDLHDIVESQIAFIKRHGFPVVGSCAFPCLRNGTTGDDGGSSSHKRTAVESCHNEFSWPADRHVGRFQSTIGDVRKSISRKPTSSFSTVRHVAGVLTIINDMIESRYGNIGAAVSPCPSSAPFREHRKSV